MIAGCLFWTQALRRDSSYNKSGLGHSAFRVQQTEPHVRLRGADQSSPSTNERGSALEKLGPRGHSHVWLVVRIEALKPQQVGHE